jgi:hypothetical protein
MQINSKNSKLENKPSISEVQFAFARHYPSKISKYHGLEMAVGQLSSRDLEAIYAFIEDEEYFDSSYFHNFYDFNNLYHKHGILVDSDNRDFSKFRDSISYSQNSIIDKINFTTVKIPPKGYFLCSVRSEDVYFVARGTAVSSNFIVPITCEVLEIDLIKPTFGLLFEVSVYNEIIDRDASGIEEATGYVYYLQQILIIDGIPRLMMCENSECYPFKPTSKVIKLNKSYSTKEDVLKCFNPLNLSINNTLDKIIIKLEKGIDFNLDKVEGKYRHSPQVVSKALELDGENLAYVSDEQKLDKELVKIAVISSSKSNSSAFKFAATALQNDINYIEELLTIDGNIVEYLCDDLKNNKKIACIAVSNKAGAIKHLNSEFKADPEIIKLAITNGLMNETSTELLEHLPKKWRDSKDIVLRVLEANGYELNYASKRLKEDKDCIKTACKRSGSFILSYCAEHTKSDLDFYYELLQFTQDSNIIEYFSDSIKDEERAFLEGAKYDGFHYIDGKGGGMIKFASNRLKNSKNFILNFIKIAPYVLNYISEDLAKDEQIKSIARKY